MTIPPKIDTEFICIFNADKPNLAATISSYVSKSNSYVPMFGFPFVTAEELDPEKKSLEQSKDDEHQMTRDRSRRFNIKVSNAIRRLGGCDHLIVAGLTDNQLSYLTFLGDYNVLIIDDIDDVDVFLNNLVSKNEYFHCSEADLVESLPHVLHNGLLLKIKENPEDETFSRQNGVGLVVIERNEKVSSVIAINYANSIGARVKLINQIDLNSYEIRTLIEKWKEGEPNAFNNLSAEIYPNIEHIDFSKYEFVTFFTDGVPYSLILKNCVPISHVHLRINPDFFVFNNIYFEWYSEPYSAIVFSPEEFEDEETEEVVRILSSKNLHVKPLIGKDATFFNLDSHIQHYVYSLLHLCSHGGEVKGERVTDTFEDRDGNQHKIEYDEIFSYGINPFQDLHIVATKRYPRKFDDMDWGGKDLREAKYPQYVFADMRVKINEHNNTNSARTRITVAGSSHIKCHDTIYPAMFHFLAASHSPIIYNNTCWSWSDIADSFLGVGARGYIGTLWAVNNSVAKNSAEIFYSNLFGSTVLSAFYKSLEAAKSTKDEDIYIFWGLHFSSVVEGATREVSRKVVISKMIESMDIWRTNYKKTMNGEHKRTIAGILNWLPRVIEQDFKKEIDEYRSRD